MAFFSMGAIVFCRVASEHFKSPSDAELYERYGIWPDRIADLVAFAMDEPEDTTANELTVAPGQPGLRTVLRFRI